MSESEIKAALTPVHTVALTLKHEAGTEGLVGLVAVGCTVRHRVNAQSWYGKDFKAVCLKPSQYSCWNPGTDKNHVRLMKAAELLVSDYNIRSTAKRDPLFEECVFLADGIMNGKLRDVVDGCLHYCTVECYDNPKTRPAWAKKKQPHKQIGSHLFFKGVDLM